MMYILYIPTGKPLIFNHENYDLTVEKTSYSDVLDLDKRAARFIKDVLNLNNDTYCSEWFITLNEIQFPILREDLEVIKI